MDQKPTCVLLGAKAEVNGRRLITNATQVLRGLRADPQGSWLGGCTTKTPMQAQPIIGKLVCLTPLVPTFWPFERPFVIRFEFNLKVTTFSADKPGHVLTD